MTKSKRILFTGGFGKAGRNVVPYLADRGHQIVNIDFKPLIYPGVTNLVADVTDSGQVLSAMTTHTNFEYIEPGNGPAPFDAVVHFAALLPFANPDNAVFRVNTMGTYNVIEAAVKLGIPKVIIASSETTYGVCFADGRMDPISLPLEEDYDINAMDSYGLSKVLNEKTARSFQLRSGSDIYALRVGNVIEPNEYETLFPTWFENPEVRRRNAFCYIDARDLGQIVDLCIQKDGLGFQVFNAGNDTNGMNISTAELLLRFFPGVPVTRELGENEALYSNRKIREVLGFSEEHDWRKYCKA